MIKATQNQNSKGFTLIELMVSISIIAILTALATVSFSAAQKKARDARRSQDMKLLQIAAEQYVMTSNGSYPASTAVPWVAGGQVILEAMPFEPKSGATAYNLAVGATAYCVCATMENPAAGNATATGIGCSFSTASTGNTGPYFCAKNRQ